MKTVFFIKRNTILLLYMYQVFILLLGHLPFFLLFFFTFMENFFLRQSLSEHIQSSDVPGMPWCNLHTCLAWDSDLSAFHEKLEGNIGKDKLKATLHMVSDKSKVRNNLAAQT